MSTVWHHGAIKFFVHQFMIYDSILEIKIYFKEDLLFRTYICTRVPVRFRFLVGHSAQGTSLVTDQMYSNRFLRHSITTWT